VIIQYRYQNASLKNNNDKINHNDQPTTMVVVRIIDSEWMAMGLELAGYRNWRRCKISTNVARFKGWFGASPKTCENMWSDMQTTNGADGAPISRSDSNPRHLLLALRWLRGYPTEKVLEGTFKMSEKTVRKWCFGFVRKIQALKVIKVSKKASNVVL
jgi:hypothetical protein